LTNIATVLKDEVARIARKQLRIETDALKKANARYRTEIADLKRRVASLEKLVKKAQTKAARVAPVPENRAARFRFSAKGLRTHRERLGLSAAEMASLIGVSAQSLYNWELGKASPRASQMGAIAALRKLGKREAHLRLGGTLAAE
jgi:DNA-binding XRE family transcriptional regulator